MFGLRSKSGMKEMMNSNRVALDIFVCFAVAFITAACGGTSGKTQRNPTQSVTASASTTPEQSEPRNNESPKAPIRQVDFKNFTYPKLPTGKCSMNEVHLTNGKYKAPETVPRKIPSVDCWSVVIGPVTYGDVTGDGEEDAIIDLYAELGGTEGSQDVYIYTLQRGNPLLLWKFATGDRADGGPRGVYAENGKLVVELFGVGTTIGKRLYGTEDVGACCPKHFTRTKYKWVGSKFQRDGPEEVFPNPSGSANPVMSPNPPPG